MAQIAPPMRKKTHKTQAANFHVPGPVSPFPWKMPAEIFFFITLPGSAHPAPAVHSIPQFPVKVYPYFQRLCIAAISFFCEIKIKAVAQPIHICYNGKNSIAIVGYYAKRLEERIMGKKLSRLTTPGFGLYFYIFVGFVYAIACSRWRCFLRSRACNVGACMRVYLACCISSYYLATNL